MFFLRPNMWGCCSWQLSIILHWQESTKRFQGQLALFTEDFPRKAFSVGRWPEHLLQRTVCLFCLFSFLLLITQFPLFPSRAFLLPFSSKPALRKGSDTFFTSPLYQASIKHHLFWRNMHSNRVPQNDSLVLECPTLTRKTRVEKGKWQIAVYST